MTQTHVAGETLLGRYRLDRVLGKGGFGTTWAAHDTQSGAQVAIKALDLSRVDDWKAVELFEREAQTLEGLDHPRIPDYLDFVPVQADETGYLVQSLAPGESLESVLGRQGSFTDAQLKGVAERTLEILTYLESLNPAVVHRDIKPANLLIDDQADVYLVDFGAVQDAAKRTTEGGSTVAGTFGYMAPEQLHGSATTRSDLFSLGMTLLHLATGRHPSELPRDGLDVAFHDHVDLPGDLVGFIERLVAPNPKDRFESASSALAYLRDEARVSPNLTELVAGETSVEETVLKLERAQQEAERRAMSQRERDIEARRRKVAARRPRAKVSMNQDEVLIEFAPVRWPTALMTAGIGAFLFANPGFVIAGGFPFFGPAWPVFADFWPGRWAVWGAFMFLACLTFVFAKTPPTHIRLSRKGFFSVYGRNEDKPEKAGRFENFGVTVYGQEPGYPGETVEIRLDDSSGNRVYSEKFASLSQADIELLDTLPDDWIQPRDEVVLDLEDQSNANTAAEPAPEVVESEW